MSTIKQKGSILLLALLVMSGSVVVGLTVGTIVLNEVRQSRNIDDAITAYYVSESAIEQGVYLFRKDYTTFSTQIEEVIAGDPIPANPQDCYFSASTFGGRECFVYWQQSPATTFSLLPGNVYQVNLFNEDLSTGFGTESLVVTWSDKNPNNGAEPWLEIEYQELASDFASGATDIFVQTCDNGAGGAACTPINGSSYAVASNYPVGSKNYKVRFRALYDSVTVNVVAYDGSGGSGDIVGTRTVDIYSTGEYRTAGQSLHAQVSSGVTTTKAFADFVLFSECDITKGFGVSAPCP